MPKVIFGPSASRPRGWSLHLDSAIQTYSTNRRDEVIPTLNLLEAEANNGAWVAVMLSYEAAPAFDSHLQTHSPGNFPLLWAAVFDRSSPVTQLEPLKYDLSEWQPGISIDDYAVAVAEIRELIARGDTYQVNYTFPMTATFQGDSLSWYRRLSQVQPADYCVYVELDGYTVLSLSPELFFERTGDHICTRPMKGTSKRGRWSAEDEAFATALSESSKQRAENVMIVDLLRNDLGRISLPGSVQVTELFHVERYPTVWQMTSTIESSLNPQTSLSEVMKALFPCGSITGAPKIRTMEIIKSLEPHPRQLYTGTIGLIKPGGDCTFNVAIRTVLVDSKTGTATFGVGGGITYSSTAENEYEECLVKSSFLFSSPATFELLESILLENGNYFLLDKHLARMEASAVYFDFPFDRSATLASLEQSRSNAHTGSWKIRLLLNRHGEVKTECYSLEQEPTSIRVGIATVPVDSNDPSLYHKLTTNLARYQEELAVHPDWDDVILWNERGEVTESSVANVVVKFGDQLITPAVSCGLLPGTFREELLERGEIQEGVITLEQLRKAEEVYLINSVRRWRTARLVTEDVKVQL